MRIQALAASAAAALLLTACGSGTMTAAVDKDAESQATLPSTATTETTTTAPTTSTPAGPSTNARGNIEKALGEDGGIMDVETGAPLVTFAVDSIGPAQCGPDWQEYYEPENGHMVAVQMRVSTTPELGTAEGGDYFTVSGYDFTFIGPDNITHSSLETVATYSCLEEAQMLTSDRLQPAQQYVGAVVLDLPAPNGTLVYRPSGMDGGWEWKF